MALSFLSLYLALDMAQRRGGGWILLSLLACGGAFAQTNDPCPRPHIGSVAASPLELRSANGVLRVELAFRTSTDIYGRTRYCYVTPEGVESPTLRVRPGDEVVVTLKNELPSSTEPPGAMTAMHHELEVRGRCGSGKVGASTTNLHWHGLNIPPACHQDEVISTLVQPSSSEEYRFRIPRDQSPGLYWYHPHPHGFSEAQVLGGGSGALIVEGIEGPRPEVAGLSERVLVLRDQKIPGKNEDEQDIGSHEPSKDLSINFVGIMYPENRPAALVARPNQREFWRVLNAAADTYFDLQLRTGPSLKEARTPSVLELVALDGAPLGNRVDEKRTHVLLAPGARAEFIATTPPEGVFAQFVTLGYDTGPNGEITPERVLSNFFSTHDAAAAPARAASASDSPPVSIPDLAAVKPVRVRRLYFSEERRDPKNPASPITYFLTVDGKTPKAFDMNFRQPDVIARQGTVEDWIIENRAVEAHAFHIHQVHFQVLERDGKAVDEPTLRDTIDLPYWDGQSKTYPSVKLRIDFRGSNVVGTFLYHCHILEHEDGGMMDSIACYRRRRRNNTAL